MTEPLVFDNVLYGADELVASFIASRIPYLWGRGFGERDPRTGKLPYAALGLIKNKTLAGGVVFHNYKPNDQVIEFGAAIDDWRCLSRKVLQRISHYPYVELDCVNVLAYTPRANKKARRGLEVLGFRFIGVMHRVVGGKADGCLYEMERKNCRWLKDK